MKFTVPRWLSRQPRQVKLDTAVIDDILRDRHPGYVSYLNTTRGPIPTHGTGGFDYNYLVANSHVGVWFRANMTNKFVVNMDVVKLRDLAFSLVFLDEKPVTFYGMVGEYVGETIKDAVFEPETEKALVRLYQRIRGRTMSQGKEPISA